MSKNPNPEVDEINLREVLAVLWAHKILIVFITGISIFFGGYYNATSQPLFSARAIFKIEQNKSSGYNLPGELGSLASIAGLASANDISSSATLLERFQGREFILNVSKKASLFEDKYFNSYNPNLTEPLWKARIKDLLGWKLAEVDQSVRIEKQIINRYRENVKFEETDGGAIKLVVTHASPQKASNYANKFMDAIRKLVEDENRAAQELRLSYLSETLADALQDMDRAQKNLKDFALANSAMAQENFISGSLQLDEIRMERRQAKDIANLLSILEDLVKKGNVDKSSYEALQLSHPLVDDVDFRRILGMSETISAWVWPEIEIITNVSATLQDRIKRLDVEIANIEENAKIYATSAEDLAKFTRDAKIAEATYTVLIEQVKSQSLSAGFQPETFKVFEYAVPPFAPSSPKKYFGLALGALLGIFASFGCALFNSKLRGVYYTRSSLIADINAEMILKSKPFRRLSQKSLMKIISKISQRSTQALNEAEIKLRNKKLIFVFSYRGKLNASDAARLLVAKSAQSGRKVVLCDTTEQSEKEIKDNSTSHSSGLPVVGVSDKMHIYKGADSNSFFNSNALDSTLNDLIAHFDQVFICSNSENVNIGLLALDSFNPSYVLTTGLRSTKKLDIKNLALTQPVDIMLYE